MVPIIDTLPSTQTNTAKEDREIAQEYYSPSEMLQDLKSQRTIFKLDASRSGTKLKVNQPKNFSYPKKNLEGKIEVFLPSWYDKGIWLHYYEAEDGACCITCKNAYLYTMLNDIRVENYFIKTGYSNWKHARSTDKGFHKHEFSNRHQQAIQRLM